MHVKLPGQDAIARQAGEQLVATRIKLPRRVVERPFRQVAKRIAMALAVLVGTALLVYAGRDGYGDNSDHKVDLLDAFYYATVTLSTTGYGDIVPVSDTARLINILVVTPLRVLFLIILVGTTLEVLTERTREEWRLHRWRHALRDHTVVVGFGTKGRSAIKTVLGGGLPDPAAGRRRRSEREGDRTRHGRGLRGRRRRRHTQRCPRARGGGQGAADHHRHPTRRHRRPRGPDGTAAQPGRAHRRGRARGGERPAAAAVRRGRGHHERERGGTPSRTLGPQPQCLFLL
ncbi:LOW QUALITY PROTEIN: ion channel membrane protein, partial [Streptomyces sp. SPB78]